MFGGVIVLSAFFLGVLLNVPYDPDVGNLMVMASTFLGGNPLLKGWIFGTVSLFTTELPVYVLGDLLFGFSWKVPYIVSAIEWALVALLIIVLSLDGRHAMRLSWAPVIPLCFTAYLAAFVAAGGTLGSTIGHLMTLVYCLTYLLLIRNIEMGLAGWRLIAMSMLLTLALIGDAFALYLFAVPMAAVCLIRFLFRIGARRPVVQVLASTAASIALSQGALAIVTFAGGFTWLGPSAALVTPQSAFGHTLSFVQASTSLFVVQWPGSAGDPARWALFVVHLSGLLLFLTAVGITLRSFRHQSFLTQALLAIVVFTVLENLVSSRTGPPRYLLPVLVFGAILASRLTYRSRLYQRQPAWVLLYFIILAISLVPALSYTKPVSPSDGLARMLVQLHLKNGYGPPWGAASATLATAGHTTVRPVYLYQASIRPYPCLSDPGWFSSYANFLVIDAEDASGLQPSREMAVGTFGQPLGIYSLGAYGDLLVWDHDITPLLGSRATDCAVKP